MNSRAPYLGLSMHEGLNTGSPGGPRFASTPQANLVAMAPSEPSPVRQARDPFAARDVDCTQAQRDAELAAEVLHRTAKQLGNASLLFWGGTAISGGLEVPTAGADTPVTIAFASAAGSLSTAALLCDSLSAALRGYVFNDHVDSIFQSLDVALDRLADVLGELAAARFPGIRGVKEAVSAALGAMQQGREALIKIDRKCRPAQ